MSVFGDFGSFHWIIYFGTVHPIWPAHGDCVIGKLFVNLVGFFLVVSNFFWESDCINSNKSVYVLQNTHISIKVAVKWNLNWDFGDGWLPEYHMITLRFWENTADIAEVINLSLACPVSLLYNQNSAFQDDGIAHLIRCCHWVPFI